MPIELCDGVKLLNQPEIASDGRNMYRSLNRRSVKTDSRGIWAKCMLETLIVGGSMCGFLSCLDIAYGVPVILLFYVAMSAYFCSLFKSGKVWVRDVGYVAFFIIFVIFIFTMRRYVNSGFYAIVNEFLDHVTDYYGAKEVKVFSEAVANRTVTIPVAALALGSVEIIILNIFLNTGMSVFWAFWFSLPIFILPLFFRLEPDGLYLFMMASGLFGVICLNGNGHYKITDKDSTFYYDARHHRLDYRHSDRASVQLVACVAMVCVVVVSIVMIIRPVKSFAYRYKDSSIKKSIEYPLGNLIMYGFESLRNSANTGGLANGKLGGVSDVSFDRQTDLILTFAPYSMERIYLKSFVGDAYSKDHWDPDPDGVYPLPADSGGHPWGKMDIKNIDGVSDLRYYPYYSDYADIKDSELLHNVYTVEYSPSALAEPTLPAVDDRYLDVPEDNIESIKTFCDSAGVTKDDSVEIALQKVYIYFVENYPYTLHPGATPRDEDYVNYFLDTTRKGLCANYATAGTLILRYLGIPARYIEGYAVDYSDVLEGTIMEGSSYKFDDYYFGKSDLGRTAVVQVDVDDSSAHAWIEAFYHGRWQVVELTPPSDEEEDEAQDDFWSRFGRWLAGDDTSDETGTTTGSSFSLGENMWLVYVLSGIVCLVIIVLTGRIVLRKILRILGYHTGDHTHNVIAYYKYMCDYSRLALEDFGVAGSHIQQLKVMFPDENGDELEQLAVYMERISYGGAAAGAEYENMMDKLRGLFRMMKKRIPVLKRIYIFRQL